MKLFLCVPFSSKVEPDGTVQADYRLQIEQLLVELRAKGHGVYCALEFADWKMGGMSLPEDELMHDLHQIDIADKLIVLLEEQISAGVQLENGYAFAKGKPVETYQAGKPAWSNIAFARLNKHDIQPVADIKDFAARVVASA